MTTNKRHTATQPGPITFNLRLDAGDIRIIAEDRRHAEILISGDGPSVNAATFSEQGRRVTVDIPPASTGAVGSPIRVEVRLPVGSSIEVDSSSAGIDVTGPVEHARIRAGTGDVRLDRVSSLDVASMSGDITVTGLAGSGRVKTMSGDVDVVAVKESSLVARSMSGDIQVTGPVRLNASTMAGRVQHRSC